MRDCVLPFEQLSHRHLYGGTERLVKVEILFIFQLIENSLNLTVVTNFRGSKF